MSRIPQINIAKAIRAYYEKTELSNSDIKELFYGKVGSTLMQSLKREARLKTIELNKPVFNAKYINTECALLAWGFTIDDLERRYQRLKKLGMLVPEDAS